MTDLRSQLQYNFTLQQKTTQQHPKSMIIIMSKLGGKLSFHLSGLM